MNQTVLVLGGARSGKSRRALELCRDAAERVFIATAEAGDDEMKDRIDHHRAERGPDWSVIEEPLDLPAILAAHAAPGRVLLVDCLTLWLSNLMFAGRDVEAECDALVAALSKAEGGVVLVSNEIGLGLVPDTALGRRFRDAQGRLNQAVAKAADRVEFVAAGLPLVMKG